MVMAAEFIDTSRKEYSYLHLEKERKEEFKQA
jgi:hypothetical protein